MSKASLTEGEIVALFETYEKAFVCSRCGRPWEPRCCSCGEGCAILGDLFERERGSRDAWRAMKADPGLWWSRASLSDDSDGFDDSRRHQ